MHDFSKMNSKELLVKTVEAVGDVELRNDHEKLKEIQNRKEKNTEDMEKKEDNLIALRQKRDELEVDMAEIRRRKELEKKLLALQKKQQWCQVSEFKITADEESQLRDDIVLEKQDLETKMAPKVNDRIKIK